MLSSGVNSISITIDPISSSETSYENKEFLEVSEILLFERVYCLTDTH